MPIDSKAFNVAVEVLAGEFPPESGISIEVLKRLCAAYEAAKGKGLLGGKGGEKIMKEMMASNPLFQKITAGKASCLARSDETSASEGNGQASAGEGLLSCRFCNGNARQVTYQSGHPYAQCTKCGAEARVDIWNRLQTQPANPSPAESVINLLKPISDQDWHGKWRIQKVIEMLEAGLPVGDAAASDVEREAVYLTKHEQDAMLKALRRSGRVVASPTMPQPVAATSDVERVADAIDAMIRNGVYPLTTCIRYANLS